MNMWETIEHIALIAIIANTSLQAVWFVWSRSIHKRKHKDD
jgi:hypothetical protein